MNHKRLFLTLGLAGQGQVEVQFEGILGVFDDHRLLVLLLLLFTTADTRIAHDNPILG